MKLKIEIPYGAFAVLPATFEIGALIAGLAQSTVITEEGYGNNRTFKVHEEKIKISILDDSFDATVPDPFKKLQDQLAQSQQSWNEQYTLRSKFEKELKELKEKLSAVSEAASKVATPAPPAKPSEDEIF